jgi:hypothetical protein
MKDVIDLEAMNGDCLAEIVGNMRIKLLCVEELGDEYIRSRQCISIRIPVNTKAFWKMIAKVTEHHVDDDKANEQLIVIHEAAIKLCRQLHEDH